MKPEEILEADLDDLVFERKNKAYGAYFLRRIYQRHITTALIISVVLFALGFLTPVIIDLLKPKVSIAAKPKITNTTLAPPPPIEPNTPPPPPPPKIPPPPPTVKLTPPVVRPDEEVKPTDIPPPTDQPQPPAPVSAPVVDPNAQQSFGPPSPVVAPVEKPKALMFVQQMPEFPGGEKALFDYLQKNINYPTAARENQVEGTVMLEFIVNEDGSISDVKALREVAGGCTEEAIRVVKSMPHWKPGVQNGANVRVYYHLPVKFSLGQSE